MISDAQLDEALHYLLDEADRDAQARADADYLREYLKVVKADLIRQQPGTSVPPPPSWPNRPYPTGRHWNAGEMPLPKTTNAASCDRRRKH